MPATRIARGEMKSKSSSDARATAAAAQDGLFTTTLEENNSDPKPNGDGKSNGDVQMTKATMPTTTALTDASKWRYVGEGGKHAVFEYKGDDTKYQGKLLRISKSVLKQETSGKEEVRQNEWFIRRVVAPYLGDLVDVPELVEFGDEFVKELYKQATESDHIPSSRLKDWRKTEEGADHTNGEGNLYYGMLVENHRKTTAPTGTSFTVELKPKAGYLAFSPLVHHNYRHVKYHQSRFQSLQQLCQMSLWKKGWQNDVNNEKEVSLYEPLDLFSGDTARIQTAIAKLFRMPQNNLRVFENGGSSGQPLSSNKMPLFLQDVLSQVLTSAKGQDLLQKILTWQKLDILDVDGACIVYLQLIKLLREQNADRDYDHAESCAQHLIDGIKEGNLLGHTEQNSDLPGLEASPFDYIPSDDDDVNSENTGPSHPSSRENFCTFLQWIQEFQQCLVEDRGSALNEPLSSGLTYVQDVRQLLLEVIHYEFTTSDCVFVLRNWLLSLMMCDVSIFITLEEEMEDETEDDYVMVEGDTDCEDDDVIFVAETGKRLRYSLHVIDCDPKPAMKLNGRAEKETGFANLS